MRLNLELSSLVNAAGGFLFLLAGAWALYLGGSRRARLVGWSAVLFGAGFVVQNLVRDHDIATSYAYASIPLGAAALLALLSAHLARDLPPRAKARIATLGGIAGVASLVLAVIGHLFLEPRIANGLRLDVHGSIALASATFVFPASTLLVAACAERFRSLETSATTERRALAGLAASYGVFAAYFPAYVGTDAPQGGFFVLPVVALAFATICTCTLVAALRFLGVPGERRVGARTFLVLLAAAFAALAVNLARSPSDTDLGSFGIARTVGVGFLVVAIVRYDLLGVTLPKFAARRGTIATAALATLLIVAQVAQNFLSAQYGLIMGGIVAGALVFAASPIQRALEGKGASPAPPAPAARASDEDIYRNALRVALRDRRVTRDEEVHLHRLATRLGIPGDRAHELLIEIEREGGTR